MRQDSHQRHQAACEHTKYQKYQKRTANTQLWNRLTVSEHAGGNQQSFHAQEHNELGQVKA